MSKEQLDLPRPLGVVSLARRVLARIRHNGPRWLIERGIREIRSPVTAPGAAINGALRYAGRLSRRLGGGYGQADSGLLLAFYDLLVEPNTFDAMWFLMAAERRRHRLGLRGIHVVFVGSPPDVAREETKSYREAISVASWRDRIANILVPLAWAMPTVIDVEVVNDRQQARIRLANWPVAHVFPEDFSVDLHRSTVTEWCREIVASPVPDGVRGAFRATEAARTYVDRWIAARDATGKVVTITVRHYAYSPARNSNLAAWARFADYLRARGYLPVFVPDTESLPEGVPAEIADYPQFVEGAVNLGLRLALYERAFVNLGINNGPAFLYLVDELAAGIMFKIITPGVEANEPPYLMKQGFIIGGQIPFCSPVQRRVWQDDDFEVIKREFEAIEPEIAPIADRAELAVR